MTLYFKCRMLDGSIGYFDIEPHSNEDDAVFERRSEMNIAYGIVKQKGVECVPPRYIGMKKVHSL